MGKRFNGVVNLDVRDSVADWDPFLAPEAPEGAPNVLVVLYDDTGLAAWSPFGGRSGARAGQELAGRPDLVPRGSVRVGVGHCSPGG